MEIRRDLPQVFRQDTSLYHVYKVFVREPRLEASAFRRVRDVSLYIPPPSSPSPKSSAIIHRKQNTACLLTRNKNAQTRAHYLITRHRCR